MRLIPHSVIGNVALFEEAQNLRKNINRRNSENSNQKAQVAASSFINPMNTTNTSKKETIKKNYFDYIDDAKAKLIFDEFKEIKEENKEKLNDFMKKLNPELKYELKQQEMNLKLKNYEENQFFRLNDFLSKRISKNPDDLLINRIDEHRLKKEFGDLMEHKITGREKYVKNLWMISLRNSKNSKFVKNSFVNMGSNYNPLWVNIRDNGSKSVDIIRSPQSKNFLDIKGLMTDKSIIDRLASENSFHMITNTYNNNTNNSSLNYTNVYNTESFDDTNNNIINSSNQISNPGSNRNANNQNNIKSPMQDIVVLIFLLIFIFNFSLGYWKGFIKGGNGSC
jgi:hypothetical protein